MAKRQFELRHGIVYRCHKNGSAEPYAESGYNLSRSTDFIWRLDDYTIEYIRGVVRSWVRDYRNEKAAGDTCQAVDSLRHACAYSRSVAIELDLREREVY